MTEMKDEIMDLY